jgi:hypothetical protein
MGALRLFKSTVVNQLCSSVAMNVNRYLCDDVWVTEVSAPGGLPTAIEPSGALQLVPPENGNLKDIENAMSLHRALRHLTPLQARDPRLWTRLVHVEFWPYMRLRWPVEKHLRDPNKAVRFIESRYLVAQSQSRALLRNGIARLWWTAELSHDADRRSPYEFTEVLLSTLDITQQILERGMGRSRNIIKGFLEFLLQNRDTLLTGGNTNRTRIRRLAKRLNMYGGVCLLDLLSKHELMNLLRTELDRILDEEKHTFDREELPVILQKGAT